MKRYPGVVTALVKEIDDQGRLKLEFQWLTKEAHRSAWAPVAAALAGKQRGAFFMPEIDDEVLVAFEHGDFDHPFVVGFLWNGVDTPPESDTSNRVIKTPGGHELRFEDGEVKKVIVKSNGGHQVEIDDAAQSITVKTNSGNQSLVLNDTSGSVELRGGGRSVKLQSGTVEIS